MTRIARCFAVLLVIAACLAGNASAAGEFSSLEERMTAAEFSAAGLDKLTTDELAALNAWLRDSGTRRPQSARATTADDRTGFRDGPDSEGVTSRIKGAFNGWSGSTRFVLENGQVWQQAESGALRAAGEDSPLVRIEPAFMGSWRLQVEGYNQRVRVKRIE
jgi:hypothetical protein